MTLVAPAPLGFERSPVLGSSLDDLDMESLERYLHHHYDAYTKKWDSEQLLSKIGLCAKSGTQVIPTVAGLLLFGRCPQLLRPEWGVTLLQIQGSTLAEPILACKHMEGSLSTLLAQAMAFVEEHASVVQDVISPARSTPEYAATAVREAIVNALIHRDLRSTAQISIRMFDNRLEIWSPGSLPSNVVVEDLARHGGISLPRNPLIASVARTLGLIDQIGRGLVMIREATRQHTSTSVQISCSQADVCIILPSNLHTPMKSHVTN